MFVPLKNVIRFVGMLTATSLYSSQLPQGWLLPPFALQPCCQREQLATLAREANAQLKRNPMHEIQDNEIRGRAIIDLNQTFAIDALRAELRQRYPALFALLSKKPDGTRHTGTVLPFPEFFDIDTLLKRGV